MPNESDIVNHEHYYGLKEDNKEISNNFSNEAINYSAYPYTYDTYNNTAYIQPNYSNYNYDVTAMSKPMKIVKLEPSIESRVRNTTYSLHNGGIQFMITVW